MVPICLVRTDLQIPSSLKIINSKYSIGNCFVFACRSYLCVCVRACEQGSQHSGISGSGGGAVGGGNSGAIPAIEITKENVDRNDMAYASDDSDYQESTSDRRASNAALGGPGDPDSVAYQQQSSSHHQQQHHQQPHHQPQSQHHHHHHHHHQQQQQQHHGGGVGGGGAGSAGGHSRHHQPQQAVGPVSVAPGQIRPDHGPHSPGSASSVQHAQQPSQVSQSIARTKNNS